MSPKVTEDYREKKVQRILDAALQVFMRKGYESTTMQDVIDEAGLSRGGLYLYFANTEEILMRLLDDFDQRNLAGLEMLLKTYDNSWQAVEVFLSQLEQGLSRILQSITPATLEFYISGWRQKERQEYEENRYGKVLQGFKNLFVKGVERGEFKPACSPEVLAHGLISFIDGISLGVMVLGKERIDVAGQVGLLRSYLSWALQVDRSDAKS